MLGRTVRGQAQGASSPQLEQRVTSPALPAAWNDGVKALADKIAASVRPSRAVSLEVKNISSLGPADVEAIRAALETELAGRGFQLGSGAGVEVTLSENVEGYVWVAEIRRNGKEETLQRIAILPVPIAPAESSRKKQERLELSANLVWQQRREFYDFAVYYWPAGVSHSTLIVLESDRLVYYRSTSNDWQVWTTVEFPHSKSRTRDAERGIFPGDHLVISPGVRCSGIIVEPEKLKCELTDVTSTIGRGWVGPKVHGYDDVVGATVGERCGGDTMAIATGAGDWTEPDSMQGLLLETYASSGIPSGSPIKFDGPVMVMSGGVNLRAIVRNLKTGNYEGYIVTATCSQ
ncbi:MAG: hypothetical protein WCC03_09505 [Candidatus Acidiferrales bacterium]